MFITRNLNPVSTYAGVGVTRPNVVPGADEKTHGPIQQSFGDQFSKATYFQPGRFHSSWTVPIR